MGWEDLGAYTVFFKQKRDHQSGTFYLHKKKNVCVFLKNICFWIFLVYISCGKKTISLLTMSAQQKYDHINPYEREVLFLFVYPMVCRGMSDHSSFVSYCSSSVMSSGNCYKFLPQDVNPYYTSGTSSYKDDHFETEVLKNHLHVVCKASDSYRN